MHILLYSKPFFPSVGGIESVSLTLAEQIVAAGHVCTVITETPAAGSSRRFPFSIERTPNKRRRLALARAADVVHSNGASLALFPYAKLARRPFLWTHTAYQMVSVEGAGWLDGQPAPLTPLASLWLHARKRGLKTAAVAAVKLGLRRAVGRLVDKNVAITNWVATRQPLPNQVVIYNPFPLGRFKRDDAPPPATRYDFLFLGRLVAEKGVTTLLSALALLNGQPRQRPATVLIVGDGEQRPELEQMSANLGLTAHVHFAGQKSDQDLLDAIAQGAVAVVPSLLEEPMGGVGLELLAAGRPLIVSERGGLAECVRGAAWTFPNGDHKALADLMAALIDDEALRNSRQAAAREIVACFDERNLARAYLDLYAELLL
ncbi:MAG TPA: glycosyltransferase family 4 protein [Polyangia bacterium]|jgi:glycosyltransferase involved in cell wall biosynthesis|nr:glycosyltransferase family 4 protein [Polyangia bacterium]